MQALTRKFESTNTASLDLDEDFLECLLTIMAEWADAPDPTMVWERLLLTPSSSDCHPPREKEDSHENADNDWYTAWSMLSKVVEQTSPTELFATVLSCSVFGETPTFDATCLALSCRALKGCPNPLTRLQKRWKSMVIETLRLFQKLSLEENSEHVVWWTEHVFVPKLFIYYCKTWLETEQNWDVALMFVYCYTARQ